MPDVYDASPVAYRSGITSPDIFPATGTVTCTKLTGVGSLTAGVYNISVVAGNPYGRSAIKTGNVAVTTETTNLGVRAAFAAVAGATYYDIYCSTDGDPKWVGRITEAQRASGIIITAVGTTGAGGLAASVDIYAIGTGLQAATTAAQSTSYSIPASPINCTAHQYCDFDLTMSVTGDSVALALTVVPYYLNGRTGLYSAGTPVVVTFGGAAGVYTPLKQRIRIEVRGNAGVALVVQSIAGRGASLDIDAIVS